MICMHSICWMPQCAHACNDTWQLRFLFTKKKKKKKQPKNRFVFSYSLWFVNARCFHEYEKICSRFCRNKQMKIYPGIWWTKQNRTVWIGTCVLVSFDRKKCYVLQEENEIEVELFEKNMYGSYAFALGTTHEIQMLWCARCERCICREHVLKADENKRNVFGLLISDMRCIPLFWMMHWTNSHFSSSSKKKQ